LSLLREGSKRQETKCRYHAAEVTFRVPPVTVTALANPDLWIVWLCPRGMTKHSKNQLRAE